MRVAGFRLGGGFCAVGAGCLSLTCSADARSPAALRGEPQTPTNVGRLALRMNSSDLTDPVDAVVRELVCDTADRVLSRAGNKEARRRYFERRFDYLPVTRISVKQNQRFPYLFFNQSPISGLNTMRGRTPIDSCAAT